MVTERLGSNERDLLVRRETHCTVDADSKRSRRTWLDQLVNQPVCQSLWPYPGIASDDHAVGDVRRYPGTKQRDTQNARDTEFEFRHSQVGAHGSYTPVRAQRQLQADTNTKAVDDNHSRFRKRQDAAVHVDTSVDPSTDFTATGEGADFVEITTDPERSPVTGMQDKSLHVRVFRQGIELLS